MKETEHVINSLKTKNSYGYDEISTKIQKISCPFISSPLYYTCNKILFWGAFTYRLKYTVIKHNKRMVTGVKCLTVDLYHS